MPIAAVAIGTDGEGDAALTHNKWEYIQSSAVTVINTTHGHLMSYTPSVDHSMIKASPSTRLFAAPNTSHELRLFPTDCACPHQDSHRIGVYCTGRTAHIVFPPTLTSVPTLLFPFVLSIGLHHHTRPERYKNIPGIPTHFVVSQIIRCDGMYVRTSPSSL